LQTLNSETKKESQESQEKTSSRVLERKKNKKARESRINCNKDTQNTEAALILLQMKGKFTI